jgi:hypothetical protein
MGPGNHFGPVGEVHDEVALRIIAQFSVQAGEASGGCWPRVSYKTRICRKIRHTILYVASTIEGRTDVVGRVPACSVASSCYGRTAGISFFIHASS